MRGHSDGIYLKEVACVLHPFPQLLLPEAKLSAVQQSSGPQARLFPAVSAFGLGFAGTGELMDEDTHGIAD